MVHWLFQIFLWYGFAAEVENFYNSRLAVPDAGKYKAITTVGGYINTQIRKLQNPQENFVLNNYSTLFQNIDLQHPRLTKVPSGIQHQKKENYLDTRNKRNTNVKSKNIGVAIKRTKETQAILKKRSESEKPVDEFEESSVLKVQVKDVDYRDIQRGGSSEEVAAPTKPRKKIKSLRYFYRGGKKILVDEERRLERMKYKLVIPR